MTAAPESPPCLFWPVEFDFYKLNQRTDLIWLAKEVGRTSFDGRVRLRVTGGDNHWYRGEGDAKEVEQVQAVHQPWHLHIGKHEIDLRARPDDAHSLIAIGGFDDLIPHVSQRLGDGPSDKVFILDHKNEAGLGFVDQDFRLGGRSAPP